MTNRDTLASLHKQLTLFLQGGKFLILDLQVESTSFTGCPKKNATYFQGFCMKFDVKVSWFWILPEIGYTRLGTLDLV